MNNRRDFLKKAAAFPLLAALVPKMSDDNVIEDVHQHLVTEDLSALPCDVNNMGTIGGVPVELEELNWYSDFVDPTHLFARSIMTIRGKTIAPGEVLVSACLSTKHTEKTLPFRLLVSNTVYSGMCIISSIEVNHTRMGSFSTFEAVVRGDALMS